MWQKRIKDINVNDLFHCQNSNLKSINIMCKLYVSLLLLPRPRVLLMVVFIHRSLISSRFEDFRSLYSSGLLCYVFLFWIWLILTSMLKGIFCNMSWAHLTVTQHVLIKKIFGIFAVSCTVHVNFITFPLTLHQAAKWVFLGHLWRFKRKKTRKGKQHSTPPLSPSLPKSYFLSGFGGKKGNNIFYT